MLKIRLFGVLIISVSYLLTEVGVFNIPVKYKDVSLEMPGHFLLYLIGLITVVSPFFVISVLSDITKGKTKAYFEKIINAINEKSMKIDRLDADDVMSRLVRFEKRTKASFITVFTVFLAIISSFPFLVVSLNNKKEFERISEELVFLIQENNLAFDNMDMYRSYLRKYKLLENKKNENSTGYLQALLAELFGDEVVSEEGFRKSLNKVYDKYVKPEIDMNGVILKKDFSKIPFDGNRESPAIRASVFTFLGVLCNYQGDQGFFSDPYFYGRQYLLAANSIGEKEKINLPMNDNSLGVNYSGVLKNFEKYQERFSQFDSTFSNADYLESKPHTRLGLARKALEFYARCDSSGQGNFSKARYLNNKTDVQMFLLEQVHLKNVKLDSGGTSDKDFLKNMLDYPEPNQEWYPSLLPEIFKNLLTELNRAIDISQNPSIYFTRAQLISLAGEIQEKYELKILFSQEEKVALIKDDLATARRMKVSEEYFDLKRMEALGLGWYSKKGLE